MYNTYPHFERESYGQNSEYYIRNLSFKFYICSAHSSKPLKDTTTMHRKLNTTKCTDVLEQPQSVFVINQTIIEDTHHFMNPQPVNRMITPVRNHCRKPISWKSYDNERHASLCEPETMIKYEANWSGSVPNIARSNPFKSISLPSPPCFLSPFILCPCPKLGFHFKKSKLRFSVKVLSCSFEFLWEFKPLRTSWLRPSSYRHVGAHDFWWCTWCSDL